MDEFRKEQIGFLEKALEYCEKGGCQGAIPFIKRRIYWLKEVSNL